jgi:ABC-type uncharacterized transport system involved in gliding motility auxiliary subunit
MQAIPFFVFDRERFIEYDVSRMISDLSNQKRIKVGLISSITMELPNIEGLINPDQMGAAPWAVLQQARQLFDVVAIDPVQDDIKIGDDIDMLMVVHPQGFSDDLLFQIDQFVMRKGRVLFFVDPDVAYGGADPQSRSSDISKLFNAWGITIDMQKAVGDRIYATALPQRDSSQSAPFPSLTNLAIQDKSSFNQDDITSADLNIITMTNAGHIRIREDSELSFTPLIQSSIRASLIDVVKLQFNMDPRQLIEQFRSDNTNYTLAARIQGSLKSAFAGKKATRDFLPASQEEANLIVVADTDILRDNAWVTTQRFLGYQMMIPHADNGSFVVNAIDNLGGSGELITLRTRGTGKRPFTVVDKLRASAEERFLSKERELQSELSRTEEALNQLQRNQGVDQQTLALTPAQQLELERFQQQKIRIRKELRSVQRELNKEIEGLGVWLKFYNIWLMPLIIAGFAVFLMIYRNRQQAGGR